MKTFLFYIVLLSCCFFSNSQADNTTQQYSERIFLTTDRNIYLSEEKIWFFARVSPNSDTLLSKVLYLELFNYDKNRVVKRKFKIKNQAVSGVIEIPANFSTNTYLISAYTNYMKNFLPDQFAFNIVSIVNPNLGIQKNGQHNGNKTNADEAFYSKSSNKGNAFIRSIQTKHNSDIKQLQLFDNENSRTYEIVLNLKKKRPVTLLCKNSEFTTVLKTTFSSSKVEIPYAKLSPGFNYCLITDTEKKLALGLIYRYPEINELTVSTSKQNYLPRQQIDLNLKNKNAQCANICISVTRKNTHFSLSDSVVLFTLIKNNPLLLNSFIRSYPAFKLPPHYLNNTLSNHIKVLAADSNFLKKMSDSLSLPYEFIPEVNDINLTGTMLDDEKNKPAIHSRVYLSVLGKHPKLYTTESDNKGRFLFTIQNETEKSTLFVSTNKKGNYRFLIHNDFSTELNGNFLLPPLIHPEDKDLLDKMYLSTQLQKKFNIHDSIKKATIPPLPYLSRYGFHTNMDNYIELPEMEEVFKEIVSHVFVRKKNKKNVLWVYNDKKFEFFKEPLLLIDNLPVFEPDKLLKIVPNSVSGIYVINNPFYIGDHTINGIIALQTTTNNYAGVEIPANGVFVEYLTLTPNSQKQPTFFEKENLPCFQNLIHWEPGVNIKDSYSTSFQAPDDIGDYEIIITGTMPDGQICKGKCNFSITQAN